MSLSDKKIIKEIKRGNIIIDPFDVNHVNPNSIDLTLSKHYKTVSRESPILDCKKENKFVDNIMPENGVVLYPGNLYIYSCNEKIGLPCKNRNVFQKLLGKGYIEAEVLGKSSIGRLGLFVHVTAGFIDTGFVGHLVLEMVATEPIRVYPNQKICQLRFNYVDGNIQTTYDKKKGSKYMNQTGPQTSLMHLNFTSEHK
jgi:dCTP deaminase